MTSHATALEPQKIPVIVPCLTADQIPAPPPTFMRADKTGDFNEIAALIDLKQADEYVVKSQSLMWGCVKPQETKP